LEKIKMEEHIHQSVPDGKVAELIHWLSSDRAEDRKKAQNDLIEMGEPVVPVIITMLSDASKELRWEAAYILAQIRDPRAALGLVKALEDSAYEVRWRAAEALVALGRDSLAPLLEALVQRLDSVWLREGAHHVLRALSKEGHLTESSIKVLMALDDGTALVSVPWAAERALEALYSPDSKASIS
jgi:HEAT repeat protein